MYPNARKGQGGGGPPLRRLGGTDAPRSAETTAQARIFHYITPKLFPQMGRIISHNILW